MPRPKHGFSRLLRLCAVFALGSGTLAVGVLVGGVIRPMSAGAGVGGVQVLGWGFDQPYAISSDGTHVWVANSVPDRLGHRAQRLDRSALVQGDPGSSYGFDDPGAIASDGTHVWVTNDRDRQLGDRAERLDGGLVKVITGSIYGFNDPDAISSDGTHVWVANHRAATR